MTFFGFITVCFPWVEIELSSALLARNLGFYHMEQIFHRLGQSPESMSQK
jgi:hypothetical protein